MTDRWLPIPGWEGMYEVSDAGRVRSVDRMVPSNLPGKMRICRGQMMKGFSLPDTDHRLVWLSRNGDSYGRLIHRLVLEAFVGPCPPGMEGCHRNDTATDNSLTNLRWDTRSANQIDSVRNGTHVNTQKIQCPRQHPYDMTIRRRDGRSYRACSKCRRIQRDAFKSRRKAA